ncbi:hypothetical protein [Flavobacterium sp.]
MSKTSMLQSYENAGEKRMFRPKEKLSKRMALITFDESKVPDSHWLSFF